MRTTRDGHRTVAARSPDRSRAVSRSTRVARAPSAGSQPRERAGRSRRRDAVAEVLQQGLRVAGRGIRARLVRQPEQGDRQLVAEQPQPGAEQHAGAQRVSGSQGQRALLSRCATSRAISARLSKLG